MFNLAFDRHIVRPVAVAYHELPDAVRYGIGNELTNIKEPLNAVHGVLRLNPKVFSASLWRFILNSTVGLGGLRDFAGENGLHNMRGPGEYARALGSRIWPVFVLPRCSGRPSARDTAGKAGDFFVEPVRGYYLTYPEDVGIGVCYQRRPNARCHAFKVIDRSLSID